MKKDKSTEATLTAGITSLRGARQELNEEKYDNAIESFTYVASKNPDNYYPYAMAGWSYYQKGYYFSDISLYAEAIKNFNKAIELNPDYYDAYNGLGWVYTRYRNYDLALKNFDKASQLNPRDSVSMNGKAYIFRDIELLDKSIEFSKEAIKLNPTNTDYYDVLGWTYHEMGAINESKEQFFKSLTIDQKDYIALTGIGWALDHEEMYDEAIPYYEKSIEIKPNFQNYEGLARAYYGKGNYQKSIELVFKELKYLANDSLSWRGAYPYLVFGLSYYRLKDLDNAIKYLSEYLLTNDDARAKLVLVSALHLKGKDDEALKLLETVSHTHEEQESGKLDAHTLDHHHLTIPRTFSFLNCMEGKAITPETISDCVEKNPAFGN